MQDAEGIAVAMIFDTSGSMENNNRISSIKQAWKQVLAPKMATYQNLNKNLDATLIKCGGEASILLPMMPFSLDINAKIDNLSAQGSTPLGESLLLAYQEISKSTKNRKHIFILTDGEATGCDPKIILSEMANRGGKNVGLHLVGFNSQRSYYAAFEEYHCQVIMVENLNQLEEVCNSIFEDILKPEKE